MSRTMTQPVDSKVAAYRTLSPLSPGSEGAQNERFPSFDDYARNYDGSAITDSPLETLGPSVVPDYKWPARRGSKPSRRTQGHKSRRSVSDAVYKLRTRQGSVSENVSELADSLKAPISPKLIVLCIFWYMTSALTNTSSKSILNAYPKPVTLTIVQFASVSIWCFIFAGLASVFPILKRWVPALRHGLRKPSVEVLWIALPLSGFQLAGHLLSSYATSKIPVSLVHTIKGLSPLFTVFAYRFVLGIRYRRATYLSLVPLTLGVMMACSTDFSSNFWGITAALIAAIVFVTQNIFSKKLFTESSRAEADGQIRQSKKLDKLNLLCYCSMGAFLFSTPVWLYFEGFGILGDLWKDGSVDLLARAKLDHSGLVFEFILNGFFHFLQNILAFVLLSMLSPVSYSVASLIKRVWVIAIALVWFRNGRTTNVQLAGVGLTMFGLYLYDRNSMEDAAERRAKADHFRPTGTLLPVTEMQEMKENGHAIEPRRSMNEKFEFPQKQVRSTSRNSDRSAWLPPGTKQEQTWLEPGDHRV